MVRHVAVNREPVGHEVLKRAAERIGCLDQHENTGVSFECRLDEGAQTIRPQVGAHRQRIGAHALVAPAPRYPWA